METEKKVNMFAVEEVKNLQMDIAAAKVRTEVAADGEIRVDARNLNGGRYVCELQSGKLVIAHQLRGIVHIPRFQEETEITLYLPSILVLDHVALEIGAGEINMEGTAFSCNKMKVEIGAGKWKAQQLVVSDCLKVEIGAGKAKMKEVTAGRVIVECGVGSCVYKGRINGDVKVNCSVGNCNFQLENKESDFSYNVSCAVGSVKINGSKIRSFAAQKTCKNKNTLGTAELECGIGNIEWSTEETGMKFSK